ncbi:hypothetical protein DDQ41_24810 [Streptomyces spongiicola]|uniref:RNA polymerase sigma-70 domain-containing protein n=1 Tax=Streptomyces spongiicola TaxID=1690221 RepID=A0ABM6VC84_9ACTN|nr:sigma-70 family RNA polymerase sigma factor [Streptomyces spongiicola]AWK11605.1 hypothetical protein DDQ41_24810 [Streptomyces spongiicola]
MKAEGRGERSAAELRAALRELYGELMRAAVSGVVSERQFLLSVDRLGLVQGEQDRLRDELARLGLGVRGEAEHISKDRRDTRKVAPQPQPSPAAGRVDLAHGLLGRYQGGRGSVGAETVAGVARLCGLTPEEERTLRARVSPRPPARTAAGSVVPGPRDEAAVRPAPSVPLSEVSVPTAGPEDADGPEDAEDAEDAEPFLPAVSPPAVGDVSRAVEAARALLDESRFIRRPESRLLSAAEEVGLGALVRGGAEGIGRPVTEAEIAALPATDIRVRARNCFVVHNQRLVRSIVPKYLEQGLDYEDLFQHGARALMRAAVKFDPTQGYKFSTYATWWIRQGLTRAVADEGAVIRIPVHMHEKMRKVAMTERTLQSQGRPARPADLAVVCDMPVHRVEGILLLSRRTDSLDRIVADGAHLGDLVALDRPLPSAERLAMEQMHRAYLLSFLERFGEREARILLRRTGLDDGERSTLEDLGREFDVTRERIRQVEMKAFETLRQMLLEAGFGPGHREPPDPKPRKRATRTQRAARAARAVQTARAARVARFAHAAGAAQAGQPGTGAESVAGQDPVVRPDATRSEAGPSAGAGAGAGAPQAAPEPVPEPVPAPEPVPEPAPAPEPVPEPAPAAVPAPVSDPAPAAEPVAASASAPPPASPSAPAPAHVAAPAPLQAGLPRGPYAPDWERALAIPVQFSGSVAWLSEYVLLALGHEELAHVLGRPAADDVVAVLKRRGTLDRPVVAALEVLQKVFDSLKDSGMRPADFLDRSFQALNGVSPRFYLAQRPLVHRESRLAVRDALREFTKEPVAPAASAAATGPAAPEGAATAERPAERPEERPAGTGTEPAAAAGAVAEPERAGVSAGSTVVPSAPVLAAAARGQRPGHTAAEWNAALDAEVERRLDELEAAYLGRVDRALQRQERSLRREADARSAGLREEAEARLRRERAEHQTQTAALMAGLREAEERAARAEERARESARQHLSQIGSLEEQLRGARFAVAQREAALREAEDDAGAATEAVERWAAQRIAETETAARDAHRLVAELEAQIAALTTAPERGTPRDMRGRG